MTKKDSKSKAAKMAALLSFKGIFTAEEAKDIQATIRKNRANARVRTRRIPGPRRK